MLMITQRLVNWAAQECEWQQSGERSVAWLIEAHQEAFLDFQDGLSVTENFIKDLARIVEPAKNGAGYRQINVRVGESVKVGWQEVPRLMFQLVELGDELAPTEWYHEFEEIHPFVDGNGRVGAILFNWLNGTLHPDKVIYPPNLWADGRREPDYGPLALD